MKAAAYTLLAVASTALLIANLHVASAQPGPPSYLYTEKDGLVLVPPVHVSESTEGLIWSPDSARLITFNARIANIGALLDHPEQIPQFDRNQPESELSIGRWTRYTHAADTVWRHRFPSDAHVTGEPVWLPETQIVTQTIFWQEKETTPDGQGGTQVRMSPRMQLLWVDAARSTVHEIPMQQGNFVSVSPSKALAVIVGQTFTAPGQPIPLTAVRVDGALGAPVSLPPNEGVAATTWTADGSKLSITLIQQIPAAKGGNTTYLLFNPVTGELARAAGPPLQKPASAPRTGAVYLKSSTEHVKEADIDFITHPLWAKSTARSEKSTMFVCSDADAASLSPDGKAIAYRANTSSWVCELKPIPLEMLKQMASAARRVQILNNGKQLALAALMWSQDHDETLPPPDNIEDTLSPYLGGGGGNMFDGFSYTFAGGSLSSIASPSETVLGTIDGPGGQAIIYADGHVKWQNR